MIFAIDQLEIDALVDWSLANYPNRSGYDFNVGQDRCSGCGDDWHGLPNGCPGNLRATPGDRRATPHWLDQVLGMARAYVLDQLAIVTGCTIAGLEEMRWQYHNQGGPT